MKIDLSENQLNPLGYDRDNGQGAAQRAIDDLFTEQDINPTSVSKAHKKSTQYSAQDLKGRLHEKTRYENGILYLGLSDVAKPLNEKVDEAIKRLDNLKE